MPEPADQRRDELAERAAYHVEAQRRQEEREAEQAQVLIDRFVEQATSAGIATQELMAKPWNGHGSYRTGVEGWYLKPDHSVAIGRDGAFYVLVVPPVRFGRFRTVSIAPAQPVLQVGKGARDGESVTLKELLRMRLEDSPSA